MDKNTHKNIFWIIGVIILISGMFLYFVMPIIFKKLELELGFGLVYIGIIMIYQIFNDKNKEK